MTISIIQNQSSPKVSEKEGFEVDLSSKAEDTEKLVAEKQDIVVLNKKEDPQEQKPSFNIFKAGWGVIKGLFKESYALGRFFVRALCHPIETIKELIAGFSALFKLIFNPQELKKALQNGWEKFKSMDSTEKGEVIGRILLNCIPVPLPLLGNTWIANARFTAKMVRLAKTVPALPRTISKMVNFIKKWGLNNILKRPITTACESIKIARQGFVEKLINIALKEEGIPASLAPRVKYVDLCEFTDKASSIVKPTYDYTSKSTIATSSTTKGFIYSHAENTFYFCDYFTWLFNNGISFTEIGERIRKDIRRLGLLIHGAKSRGKVPLVLPREVLREALFESRIYIPKEGFKRVDEIAKDLQRLETDIGNFYLLPETVWQTAHELKPPIKTCLNPGDIPHQFSESVRLLEEFQLSLKPLQEMQHSLIFKIISWRSKRRRMKTSFPDIKINPTSVKVVLEDSTKGTTDLKTLIANLDPQVKPTEYKDLLASCLVTPPPPSRGFIRDTYDLIIKIKELARTSTKKYFEYKNHPFEKEVQIVIKGKSGGIPLFRSPSIHNLPRLAPKEENPQQENNKQNGSALNQAA